MTTGVGGGRVSVLKGLRSSGDGVVKHVFVEEVLLVVVGVVVVGVVVVEIYSLHRVIEVF
jgi:hypothetical protein